MSDAKNDEQYAYLHKADLDEVKKRIPALQHAIKEKIQLTTKKKRFEILDVVAGEIKECLLAGMSYVDISDILKQHLKLRVNPTHITEYVQERLHLKRVGTYQAKLAKINEKGEVLEYLKNYCNFN